MTMEYKNIEINYCNIYSDEEINIEKYLQNQLQSQ